ncbi:hypothetical protein SBA4_1260004 [Candidatus Sulfopaludibacter sp. SbA4]|nr:hypothetical protein SBA4_1260004 [Candidatus Sulfopaludibacter sp. SbA4]
MTGESVKRPTRGSAAGRGARPTNRRRLQRLETVAVQVRGSAWNLTHPAPLMATFVNRVRSACVAMLRQMYDVSSNNRTAPVKSTSTWRSESPLKFLAQDGEGLLDLDVAKIGKVVPCDITKALCFGGLGTVSERVYVVKLVERTRVRATLTQRRHAYSQKFAEQASTGKGDTSHE